MRIAISGTAGVGVSAVKTFCPTSNCPAVYLLGTLAAFSIKIIYRFFCIHRVDFYLLQPRTDLPTAALFQPIHDSIAKFSEAFYKLVFGFHHITKLFMFAAAGCLPKGPLIS